METEKIYFKKKERISASAQKASGYLMITIFLLAGLSLLLLPLFYKFENLYLAFFIGGGLLLLFLAYLAYRGTIKRKKVEADNEKIYIHFNKVDKEEIDYTQISGGTRGRTNITKMLYLKLHFIDNDGVRQVFRFIPRNKGNYYNNFLELLQKKNPELKIHRKSD